MTEVMHKKTN